VHSSARATSQSAKTGAAAGVAAARARSMSSPRRPSGRGNESGSNSGAAGAPNGSTRTVIAGPSMRAPRLQGGPPPMMTGSLEDLERFIAAMVEDDENEESSPDRLPGPRVQMLGGSGSSAAGPMMGMMGLAGLGGLGGGGGHGKVGGFRVCFGAGQLH